MTLWQLYPPIAGATVVNVFLFALMWRGHQIHKRTGVDPWLVAPAILAYIGSVAGWFYFKADGAALTSGVDYFAAALAGETMGAAIVYGLLNGFRFSKGQPWPERAAAIGGSLFLMGLVVVSLFKMPLG